MAAKQEMASTIDGRSQYSRHDFRSKKYGLDVLPGFTWRVAVVTDLVFFESEPFGGQECAIKMPSV